MIRVHIVEVIALIVIFFVTSVVGVVTGGNSLITVPVMLSFGIEPCTAVATNMFALTFLSFGVRCLFWGQALLTAVACRSLSFSL